jgi:hypothetical protein
MAGRVVAPADPASGHAIVLAAICDGAAVSAAVEGTLVIGVDVTGGLMTPPERPPALGVAARVAASVWPPGLRHTP